MGGIFAYAEGSLLLLRMASIFATWPYAELIAGKWNLATLQSLHIPLHYWSFPLIQQ